MAQILKLDTFDFSVYTRLHPDEKFDPGMNPVEPRFGEAAAGEGQPLIAFDEPNKVLSWPVHLTPFKSASYADNEDGLNDLVIDVNGACKNAKRVEWRMDGATNSTFWDVQAAVFKPDFSYFKTRQFWLSGILTVYVKTYGDTGTLRAPPGGGTAAGTGVAVVANLGALEGDSAAQVRAIITVGSQAPHDGRIVGVALVPSSYTWDVPLASISAPSSAIVGASGAAGSQYLQVEAEIGDGLNARAVDQDGYMEAFRFSLSPASAYIGRNRVIAVANHSNVGGVLWRLSDADAQRPLSRSLVASAIGPGGGWAAAELGGFTVPRDTQAATVTFAVSRRLESDDQRPVRLAYEYAASGAGGGLIITSRLRLSRLLVLPDETTSLVVDSRRLAVGGIAIGTPAAGDPVTSKIDMFGLTLDPAPVLAPSTLLDGPGSGFLVPSSATFALGAFTARASALDIKVRASYENLAAASFAVASTAIYVGAQNSAFATVWHGARLHAVNASLFAFSIVSVTAGSGIVNSVFASLTLPSHAAGFRNGILEARLQGRQITARLYSGSAGEYTTQLQASASQSGVRPNAPSDPAVGMIVPSQFGKPDMPGVDYTSAPSQPVAPADRYVFDGTVDRTWAMTAASAYVRERDSVRRGALARAVPSTTAQVVGFVLPLDNDLGNDLIALEVKVRERFQYAR